MLELHLAQRQTFELSLNKTILNYHAVRFLPRLLILIICSTQAAVTTVRGQGGLVLEKPFPWSPTTEINSVKEFSRTSERGNLENGYNEYFIGTNGKRFSSERDRIAKVIFYPNIDSYQNIQDDAQLLPIVSDIKELRSSAATYPVAKRYLDRQIAKLEGEVSLFRQGARKINGAWHSAGEIARQRREAAEREAKIEAERRLEQEKQAKIRAAAKAAFDSQIAKVRQEAAQLFANALVSQSELQQPKSLNNIKELPSEVQNRISRVGEKIRSLCNNENSAEIVAECRSDIAALRALEVRARIPRKIQANDAAGALVEVDSFLRDYPAPSLQAETDLWTALKSIRGLCTSLENEAKPHVQKGLSLSSAGKSGDAIHELEEAYRTFPDPKIAEIIKQLRETSLGL